MNESFVIKQAFPAYRIFIFGYEVTEDVINITRQWHDGAQPSTIQVTLVSPEDKYIVTHDDILKIVSYRDQSFNTNLIPNNTIETAINSSSSNATASDVYDTKWGGNGIINAKLKIPSAYLPEDATNQESVTGISTAAQQLPVYRYPFQCGKPVFHPMDPVRIAFRDPFDPSAWYWMFAGTVSDFTEAFGTDHERTLTIVAEDPSKLLRYGRFTANSGLVDIVQQQIRNAIVSDVAFKTAFANVFSDLTLPQIFYGMLFGVNAFGNDVIQTFGESIDRQSEILSEILYSANGSARVSRPKWGVGHPKLSESKVVVFGPVQPGDDVLSGVPPELGAPVFNNSLEDYQKLIDHKVLLTDLSTMRGSAVSLGPIKADNDITTIEEVITQIGTRPDVYPVDGGRLIMLLPASFGTGNGFSTIKDITGNSFAMNTEWATRSDILYEIIQYVEFSFYTSPRGDWIVEFPLYDFMPRDFGAYQKYYDLQIDDTVSVDSTFTDAKVYTQAVTTWHAIQGQNFTNQVSREVNNNATVTLWHLIPMYGVRHAPTTPRAYIASEKGARLYSHIVLNRLNADAYTQSVRANPNIQAWLNRPMLVNARDHVGTVKNISHTITWGQDGDMETQLGLYAMRGWDGSVEPIGPQLVKVYSPIGGQMSRPLNYKTLFAGSTQRTTNG